MSGNKPPNPFINHTEYHRLITLTEISGRIKCQENKEIIAEWEIKVWWKGRGSNVFIGHSSAWLMNGLGGLLPLIDPCVPFF